MHSWRPSIEARRKSRLPVVLQILSVGIICAAGCQGQNPKPAMADAAAPAAEAVPVTVASVEVRPVRRRVSVVGALYGFERIVVTPKVEGMIQATHYDVGDRVQPNSVLLELDPIDYQLALDEAQRSLEQELSRLDLTEPPTDEFDIEQLPSVQRARLLRENAQQQFARKVKLLEDRATSKESYEEAETAVKVAEASLRQAQLEARITLAAVRQRQSMRSIAQQKLSETQVKASAMNVASGSGPPADFVVAKRMASVGEMVRAFPSTPVFELIMDDVLKLHVMIPERYMSQVKMGLDVEVHVEAYPKEVFLGKVARISPTVDPQSRSFDVEAHVPNSDHRLKHGGFAKAEVVVGAADAAITVPIEAVTRFAGVSKVFRVLDGAVQEVEIEIATQGPGWVEALGGLQAGDVVVTSGQSQLANGSSVKVRERLDKTARRK